MYVFIYLLIFYVCKYMQHNQEVATKHTIPNSSVGKCMSNCTDNSDKLITFGNAISQMASNEHFDIATKICGT